uniref:Uncharacterized protein n=1 Tax=Anguilla anguilla TaxID=7936 RepID=A0A0E9VKJ9_ANGAN
MSVPPSLTSRFSFAHLTNVSAAAFTVVKSLLMF